MTAGDGSAPRIKSFLRIGMESALLESAFMKTGGSRSRAHRRAPDVDIYVLAVDERLNENSYILHGLDDAGDKIFGAK